MSFSLEGHQRQYDISYDEAFLALRYGISGAPYAQRHWELSQETKGVVFWGHRVVAVIEYIPLAGALVALIERIVVYAYHQLFPPEKGEDLFTGSIYRDSSSNSPSRLRKIGHVPTHVGPPPGLALNWPRSIPLTFEQRFAKMVKNSTKLIMSHIQRGTYSVSQGHYAMLPKVDAFCTPLQKPLTFMYSEAAAQGQRLTMEDAHFIMSESQLPGLLAGVFDGHGGAQVAKFASSRFTELFFSKLTEYSGDVHKAFEEIFLEIHQEVEMKPIWKEQGSTAVIIYLDKATGLLYTATLGDSEATLYRAEGESFICLPLSFVKDWSNQKDAIRADEYHGTTWRRKSYKEEGWVGHLAPQTLRVPENCLNVSRAIGDVWLTPVGHKPKITVHQAMPGWLVLACDGYEEHVNKRETADRIKQAVQDSLCGRDSVSIGNVAKVLRDYALSRHTPNRHDNVTVIAIEIQSPS